MPHKHSVHFEIHSLKDSQKTELKELTGESEFEFHYFSLFVFPKKGKLQRASVICNSCATQKFSILYYKSHKESDEHLQKLIDNGGFRGTDTMVAKIDADSMNCIDFDNESQQYSCIICNSNFVNYEDCELHCQSSRHLDKLTTLQNNNSTGTRLLESPVNEGNSFNEMEAPMNGFSRSSGIKISVLKKGQRKEESNGCSSKEQKRTANTSCDYKPGINFYVQNQSYLCNLCCVPIFDYRFHSHTIQHIKMAFLLNFYPKFSNDNRFFWEKYWFYIIEIIQINMFYCTVCKLSIKFDLNELFDHLKSSKHEKKCNLYGSFADFYENLRLLIFFSGGKGYCSLCNITGLQFNIEDMQSLWRHFLSFSHLHLLTKKFEALEKKNSLLFKMLETLDPDYSFTKKTKESSGTKSGEFIKTPRSDSVNNVTIVVSGSQENMTESTPTLTKSSNNIMNVATGTQENTIVRTPNVNNSNDVGLVANGAQENIITSISSVNSVKNVSDKATETDKNKTKRTPNVKSVDHIPVVAAEQLYDFYLTLKEEDKVVLKKHWFYAKRKKNNARETFCSACKINFPRPKTEKLLLKQILQHSRGKLHKKKVNENASLIEFDENVKYLLFFPANKTYCSLCAIFLSDCSRENIYSIWKHFLSSKHFGCLEKLFEKKKEGNLKVDCTS